MIIISSGIIIWHKYFREIGFKFFIDKRYFHQIILLSSYSPIIRLHCCSPLVMVLVLLFHLGILYTEAHSYGVYNPNVTQLVLHDLNLVLMLNLFLDCTMHLFHLLVDQALSIPNLLPAKHLDHFRDILYQVSQIPPWH